MKESGSGQDEKGFVPMGRAALINGDKKQSKARSAGWLCRVDLCVFACLPLIKPLIGLLVLEPCASHVVAKTEPGTKLASHLTRVFQEGSPVLLKGR